MAATTRNYRAVTRQPRLGPQPALTGSHSAFLGWVRARYTPLATPTPNRGSHPYSYHCPAGTILLQGGESCPLLVPGSRSHPSPPLLTRNTREGRAFWVPFHPITPSFPSLSLSSPGHHQTKQRF